MSAAPTGFYGAAAPMATAPSGFFGGMAPQPGGGGGGGFFPETRTSGLPGVMSMSNVPVDPRAKVPDAAELAAEEMENRAREAQRKAEREKLLKAREARRQAALRVPMWKDEDRTEAYAQEAWEPCAIPEVPPPRPSG
jgi:hypothetical protein